MQMFVNIREFYSVYFYERTNYGTYMHTRMQALFTSIYLL